MSDHQMMFKIDGIRGLFDLSSGYGGSDKIGTYDGQIPIYSAEGFLCTIEECCDMESSVVRAIDIDMTKVYKGRNYL